MVLLLSSHRRCSYGTVTSSWRRWTAVPFESWLRTVAITSSPQSVGRCFGVTTTALWSELPMFGSTTNVGHLAHRL